MEDGEGLLLVEQGQPSNVQEVAGNGEIDCRRQCPKLLLGFILLYLFILVAFLGIAVVIRKESRYPHIIVIIADDLGWGDVEWNDPEMRTPALAALAEDGVILSNAYAHPLDSPSRASLFTGMYPYHLGLQHEEMLPQNPAFLPEDARTLAEALAPYKYSAHLMGKWHLGFCDVTHTPTHRGFQGFGGFYTDSLDYVTHRDANGHYDFRTGEMVDTEAEGTHSTRVISERAVDVIRNHDVATPLLLVTSFQAVHAPLQVEERYLNETCGHINDTKRREMCAAVAMMDDAIANMTSELRAKDMLANAVIVVTSDNGGQPDAGSSNGPLRGGRGELYEGGTRVVSLMSSERFLSGRGATWAGLFHQADWLPTLTALAATPLNAEVDGIDQWQAIYTDGPSVRTEVVYNIDDKYNHSAIRVDNFKLILGPADFALASPPPSPRLYDLGSDPGETTNLADSNPEKVAELTTRLTELRKTLKPAKDKPNDPKSDPGLYNGVWSSGWC